MLLVDLEDSIRERGGMVKGCLQAHLGLQLVQPQAPLQVLLLGHLLVHLLVRLLRHLQEHLRG